MRFSISVRVLSAAAALALLAGCFSNSAVAPRPSAPQGQVRSLMGRVPVGLSPIGMLKVNPNTSHHFKSFNRCPATGPIVYMSDFNNSVINIYKVPFAGQAPCGQLTTGLLNPQGMFLKESTHELYVANTSDLDVVVFRRGATSPFKTYTDSTNGGQYVLDVTVAKDGTVIATNIFSPNNSTGSISTWHRDGTFVGNFPNATTFLFDYYITVQKNGTVYWDDESFNLFTGSCPAGACGKFTATGATFAFPGGVRSADGEDVVLQDQSGPGRGDANTYEPPDFSHPETCALGAGDPVTFDINRPQHHYFYADAVNNVAAEVGYPTCTLIGTVPGNSGGLPIGIAKDEPETL